MNAPKILVDKKTASEKYQEYLRISKASNSLQIDVLKKAYRHLRQGHPIIDIYEVFKAAGINEMGDPKLAIGLASVPRVVFRKRDLGAGVFLTKGTSWRTQKADIELPPTTFPEWTKNNGLIARRELEAKTPIIPAAIFPKGNLSNYYILWEVNDWQEIVPVMGDPLLLKRLNKNTYAVIGEWDVTPLEQAIARGI